MTSHYVESVCYFFLTIMISNDLRSLAIGDENFFLLKKKGRTWQTTSVKDDIASTKESNGIFF